MLARMGIPDALERGRRSFESRSWEKAYAFLREAAAIGPIEPQDLDRLATAAYLTGRDEESTELWAQAHHEYLSRGLAQQAVRSAFWLALSLLLKGDAAPAGGWFARAARLLESEAEECAEHGYLMIPKAIQLIFAGSPADALPMFDEATRIAQQCGDGDLATLSRHGHGQALVAMGETASGVAMLDEAMVAVVSGETSPIVTGIVYCAVIDTCHDMFDLRRAGQWTDALTRWCESQPDLVPYRGQCLVHRAELLQLHGAWQESMEETQRARLRLSDPPGQAAIGEALYHLGELHRLRGSFDEAERAYRDASERGRLPQPGLALLRLAQGRTDAAAAAIRAAIDSESLVSRRSRLLPAAAEILVAAGDPKAARAAADDLTEAASAGGTPLLRALADHADAAVRLAEGDARGALIASRRALATWLQIEAPYEAARCRMLIAGASRALGDEDAAAMETDAARTSFEALGAAPDLAGLGAAAPAASPSGLTDRELQVLRELAAGKTNRGIAEDLVISEKTVARHVSNIFTKLGLSSRAAATAYAYENDLVQR